MTSRDIEIVHPPQFRGKEFSAALSALAEVGNCAQLDYRDRLLALEALSDRLLASGPTGGGASAGMAFLAGFLRRSNLESLLFRELPTPASLLGFSSIGARKSLRVLPKGIVCHWIAGNVPLLAMFSWAISAVLGNRNVLRLSTRQDDFVSPLLAQLGEVSEAGRQMATETIVASFDRDNRRAHQQMSEIADVRIAWGGQESIETIRNLPARWHCEDVAFGPRMSLAVIDPQDIDDRALGRLVTDVVYFDQLACSSPQYLFVKGSRGDADFDGFLDRFTRTFSQQAYSVTRHPLDFAETYQIQLDRTRALLSEGSLWHDPGTQWTVSLLSEPIAEIVCANRFVQVVPFTTWESIIPQIPRNVQTVVVSLGASETAEFTEVASRAGVCRFPRPGEGNHFENPWDGVPLVSRLTRWVVRTDHPQAST